MAPIIAILQIAMIHLYFLIDFKLLPVFTMALTMPHMILFQRSDDHILNRAHTPFIIVGVFGGYLEMYGILNVYLSYLLMVLSTDHLIKWMQLVQVRKLYHRHGVKSHLHQSFALNTIIKEVRSKYNDFR